MHIEIANSGTYDDKTGAEVDRQMKADEQQRAEKAGDGG